MRTKLILGIICLAVVVAAGICYQSQSSEGAEHVDDHQHETVDARTKGDYCGSTKHSDHRYLPAGNEHHYDASMPWSRVTHVHKHRKVSWPSSSVSRPWRCRLIGHYDYHMSNGNPRAQDANGNYYARP